MTLYLLCFRAINKNILHKVTVQFRRNKRENGKFLNNIAAEEALNEAAFATTSTK